MNRRFFMKARRMTKITRLWLGLILVLALLPWAGIATADATLDYQLVEAAGRGDVELVKTILGKGASVNAEDDHGMTALMAASRQGHVEVAQLLVERDADVNARDSAGETALMHAASKGLFEAVKLLVENGAGLREKGRGGATAMEMAQKNGHAEIVEFLKVRTYAHPCKNWFGEVVSCTPRALGVRVLVATEVIMLRLARSTESSRLNRSPVGATVEVLCRLEAGGKIGRVIKVLDPK
jgi:uncharacterized protein